MSENLIDRFFRYIDPENEGLKLFILYLQNPKLKASLTSESGANVDYRIDFFNKGGISNEAEVSNTKIEAFRNILKVYEILNEQSNLAEGSYAYKALQEKLDKLALKTRQELGLDKQQVTR